MDLSLNLNPIKMINTEKRLFVSYNIESLLLSVVAALGLIGSIYIFAANASGPSNNNFNQFSAATTVTEIESSEDKAASFKDFMNISGKKKVGNDIEFKSKMDIKEKRYVMEMGDGMRMIITQPEFSYQYAEKGKYLLELKTIERGLITTVATKTLKIK